MKFAIDSNSDDRESGRKVENYRSRKAKYRLMAIVFSLMLVFVLMGEALKPETWERFSGSTAEPQAPAEEDIDTRLDGPLRPVLPPGVFEIPRTTNVDDPSAGQSQLGVNLSRYGAIKDNTVFRSAEMSIWFDTLVALRDFPAANVTSLDPQQTSFTQLYRQPDQYRGRLVKVAGTVRRAEYHNATKNGKDIPGYWQCWLRPDGSQNPIVIYALDLPEKFSRGEEVYERATFTGVFFKRWAYEATGGIMTAPVVLAHQIEWAPPVITPPKPMPNRLKMFIGMVTMSLLSAVIAVAAYRYSLRTDKKVEDYRVQDVEAQAAIEKLSLQDIPTEDDRVRSELARREGGDD